MTMWDAPSDRDYSEYLNPSEPDEDPDNIAPAPLVERSYVKQEEDVCPF